MAIRTGFAEIGLEYFGKLVRWFGSELNVMFELWRLSTQLESMEPAKRPADAVRLRSYARKVLESTYLKRIADNVGRQITRTRDDPKLAAEMLRTSIIKYLQREYGYSPEKATARYEKHYRTIFPRLPDTRGASSDGKVRTADQAAKAGNGIPRRNESDVDGFLRGGHSR